MELDKYVKDTLLEIIEGVTKAQKEISGTSAQIGYDQQGDTIRRDPHPCNHIHGVYGDYVQELHSIAEFLDVPVKVFQ